MYWHKVPRIRIATRSRAGVWSKFFKKFYDLSQQLIYIIVCNNLDKILAKIFNSRIKTELRTRVATYGPVIT
jgi:hypothetical protein